MCRLIKARYPQYSQLHDVGISRHVQKGREKRQSEASPHEIEDTKHIIQKQPPIRSPSDDLRRVQPKPRNVEKHFLEELDLRDVSQDPNPRNHGHRTIQDPDHENERPLRRKKGLTIQREAR